MSSVSIQPIKLRLQILKAVGSWSLNVISLFYLPWLSGNIHTSPFCATHLLELKVFHS